MNIHELDDFTLAYIECALWSSTDDAGKPLDDNFDAGDLSPEALKQIIEDCQDFQDTNKSLINACDYGSQYSKDEYAGHDFWLTRNRHGAGFWDRGLGDLGHKLTEAAHGYGECSIYVGDDGKLHL